MKNQGGYKSYQIKTTLLLTLLLLATMSIFQNCAEKSFELGNGSSSNSPQDDGGEELPPPPPPPPPPAPAVPKQQVWNAPGQHTFVAPITARAFKMTMVGGGGGGGTGQWGGGQINGCNVGGLGAAYSAPGGASGSAFNNKDVPIRGGQTVVITVGAGGEAACNGGRGGVGSMVSLQAKVAGEVAVNYVAGGGGGGPQCLGCSNAGVVAGSGGDIPGNKGGSGAEGCSGNVGGGGSPLGALGGAGGAGGCAGKGTNGANGYVRLDWVE